MFDRVFRIRNRNSAILRYSAKLHLISKIKCFQTNSARLDNGQTQLKRLHIHSQATNKQITLKQWWLAVSNEEVLCLRQIKLEKLDSNIFHLRCLHHGVQAVGTARQLDRTLSKGSASSRSTTSFVVVSTVYTVSTYSTPIET